MTSTNKLTDSQIEKISGFTSYDNTMEVLNYRNHNYDSYGIDKSVNFLTLNYGFYILRPNEASDGTWYESSHGVKYYIGENVDQNTLSEQDDDFNWRNTKKCSRLSKTTQSGLYFSNAEDVIRFAELYQTCSDKSEFEFDFVIAVIQPSPDAMFYVFPEQQQFQTNKFTIVKFISIQEYTEMLTHHQKTGVVMRWRYGINIFKNYEYFLDLHQYAYERPDINEYINR